MAGGARRHCKQNEVDFGGFGERAVLINPNVPFRENLLATRVFRNKQHASQFLFLRFGSHVNHPSCVFRNW
eukprot:scaffold2901_cov99-Skeletonema_marinoi.AAC.5